jgi:uncharacterized protein YkwD
VEDDHTVTVTEEDGDTGQELALGATIDPAHSTLHVVLQDVPAGTSVWLVYGNVPSDSFCSDFFDGLCLSIESPRISAERVADGSGTVEMSIDTEPFASAHLVQAVFSHAPGDFVAMPLLEATAPPIPDKPCSLEHGKTEAEVMECAVVDLVNELRYMGLDCGTEGVFSATNPVTMHPQLIDASRVHSAWMAETGNFSHGSPGGPYGDTMVERVESSGYTNWQRIAENIAYGQHSPEVVVNAWAASDGHCANLMNPNLEHIGVGLIYSRSGRPYWTQDFGTTF